MAEYSKQYCKIKDMGYDGDFDVYEIWSKLKPGHAVDYICEGFGFNSIARSENEDRVLVYLNDKWVNFDDIVVKAQHES